MSIYKSPYSYSIGLSAGFILFGINVILVPVMLSLILGRLFGTPFPWVIPIFAVEGVISLGIALYILYKPILRIKTTDQCLEIERMLRRKKKVEWSNITCIDTEPWGFIAQGTTLTIKERRKANKTQGEKLEMGQEKDIRKFLFYSYDVEGYGKLLKEIIEKAHNASIDKKTEELAKGELKEGYLTTLNVIITFISLSMIAVGTLVFILTISLIILSWNKLLI